MKNAADSALKMREKDDGIPHREGILTSNQLADILFPSCKLSDSTKLSRDEKRCLKEYHSLLSGLDRTVRKGKQYRARLELPNEPSYGLLVSLFPNAPFPQQENLSPQSIPNNVLLLLKEGEKAGGVIGLRIGQTDRHDNWLHHHNLKVLGVIGYGLGGKPLALLIYCSAEKPDGGSGKGQKKQLP